MSNKSIISVSVAKKSEKFDWDEYRELIHSINVRHQRPNKDEVIRKYFENSNWKRVSGWIKFDRESSDVHYYVSNIYGKHLEVLITGDYITHISEY